MSIYIRGGLDSIQNEREWIKITQACLIKEGRDTGSKNCIGNVKKGERKETKNEMRGM